MIVSRKRCKIETQLQRKTNRKSYVVYQMAPFSMPLNDLEDHFCCLKSFTACETQLEFTNIARRAVPLSFLLTKFISRYISETVQDRDTDTNGRLITFLHFASPFISSKQVFNKYFIIM